MITKRSQIIELVESGAIPADKVEDALIVVGIVPRNNAWRKFIDQLLLWLGGLSLAVAALFFIAYNWQDMGRFAKFGMVESLMLLTVVAYCRSGEQAVAGRVALLGATILLGVLLALYGQTYQTGVDPWQLFFTWALLMLPWAFIGRLPALWIVWLVLMNISCVLYQQATPGRFWFSHYSGPDIYWQLFILNSLSLAAWELFSKKWGWLSQLWAVRLLAVGSGLPITILVINAILVDRGSVPVAGLVWVVWLATMYAVYRRIKPDLFMLAEGCLSWITVTVTFFGRHILQTGDAGAFLFLALLVIGLGAGAAFWLNHIHQESSHGSIDTDPGDVG